MAAGKKQPSSSSSSLLAPGFRFHPTDEELVRYYLRRKVCGKDFVFDAISDVDIYKIEPWDLSGFSRLKTRDLEWYFFSVLDKKYGNGARTNRATEKGYWKTTGKDRSVYHKSQIVGMKKTLVFHIGRAPKGERSNWVMHEYRLTDLELEKAGIAQDAFVVCRVFQKSGSGPKNGEQYGAPFVEDDWEVDDVELVQKSEVAEVVDSGDDFCFNCDDLEQILGLELPSEASPHDAKLNEGTTELVDDTSIIFTNAVDQYCKMDSSVVEHQYIRGSSKPQDNPGDLDFLLDENFIDALDGLPFENTGFLESNDPMNPIETDDSSLDMLEEYLMYFDANDNTQQFVFDQELHPTEVHDAGVKDDFGTVVPSAEYKSDVEYPVFEKASHMLGSINAPPAFAAEFPSKEAVLRLNLNTDGNPSLGKSGEKFNIVVSFGFSQGKGNVESSLRMLERKTAAAVSRCWVYFMLFWIVILSVSFKIGICICAK